jgi:maleate isomerase
MYGWRARIGLILPMDNTVMEPEYYALGLEGISFHGVRMDTIERSQMPVRGAALSSQFVEMGVDGVGYACAETSFLKGVDGNAYIKEQIEKTCSLPAVTASGVMVEALQALGAKNVALVMPYPQTSADAMLAFVERQGFGVANSVRRDFNDEYKDKRDWYHTNLQPASVAYRMARRVHVRGADAVFIAATNFRTMEIIPRLEDDLGCPVVSTNSAILWSLFRTLGVKESAAKLGSLFDRE